MKLFPKDFVPQFWRSFFFTILGSYEKFQPGFRDKKRPNTSCGAKFEKQSKHSETQDYNFHAYYSFGNSYSGITAVEWDAYDVENTADNAR